MNTLTQAKPTDDKPGAGAPWWKFPIVWLVVGGPLIVVVASLNMVAIAVRNVDPVLDASQMAKDIGKPGHVPAVQGRNRAADTAMQPAEH
jgi:hypothetical protein